MMLTVAAGAVISEVLESACCYRLHLTMYAQKQLVCIIKSKVVRYFCANCLADCPIEHKGYVAPVILCCVTVAGGTDWLPQGWA